MNANEIKESYVSGVFQTLKLMLKRQKYYRLVINGGVFKYSELTSNRNSVIGVQMVNGDLSFGTVGYSNRNIDITKHSEIEQRFINAIWDTSAYGVDLAGVTDISDISIHVATDLNLILIETATFKFIRDNLLFAINGGLGDDNTDTTNYYSLLKSVIRGMDFSDESMSQLDALYLGYNKLFNVDNVVYRVDKSMLGLTGEKTYVEFSGEELASVRDFFLYKVKSSYIDIFNISMNAIKSKDTDYMNSSESQFLNYTGALLSGSREVRTFLPVFISHDDFINPYLDYIPNVSKLFRNFTKTMDLRISPVKYGNFLVYYFSQFEVNLMLDNRNLIYLDNKSLQIWLLNKTYKDEENVVYIRALDNGNTIIDYYTYKALSKSEKASYTPRPAKDLLAINLASLLGIDQNSMLDIVNGRELV